MKRLTTFLFISSFFLISSYFKLGAQMPDFSFEHFGFNQGLTNLTIQCLKEDQKGYLWIGTYNGLFRYDGYEFKHYGHQPFDSRSLAANDIKDIQTTKNGHLYIGMQGGISKYDWEKDQFDQIKDSLNPERLIRIKSLCIDSMQRVWASQRFNPSISGYINSENQLIRQFKSLSLDLLADKEGLWVAESKGLFFYHFEQDSLYQAHAYKQKLKIPKTPINTLLLDHNRVLWIGTQKGLYSFDLEHEIMVSPKKGTPMSLMEVNALYEDHLHRIWVGTNEGLALIADGKYQGVFQHDPNDERGLKDNHVTSLEQDKAGNLWVGTSKRGLHKLRLKGASPFKAWNSADFGFATGHIRVFSFAEGKKDRLWVGTNEGLFLLDRKSKKINRHFKLGKEDSLGLSHPWVRSVVENEAGEVLIGLQLTGMNVYNLKRNSMWHMNKHGFPSHSHQIRNIFRDTYKEGRYWLIGNSIHHIDLPDTNIFHHKLLQTPPQKKLLSYSWEGIQLAENHLLIANQKGLLHLYPEQDSSVLFSLFPSSYISEHQAISILPEADNNFWLGTYADGLLLSDAYAHVEKYYSTQDGLDDNVIIGMVRDSSGYIWMSTARGISRFDPQKEQFQNYHIEGGIHGEEFETGAYMQTKEGEIYFGGADGFTSFYPHEIEDESNDFQPPLYLTEVNLSGPEIYEAGEVLTFTSYLGQQLELKFVALDLSQPQKIRYQWFMEGYEDTWQNPSSEKSLRYSNLPPGDYTFHLRASNGAGIFSGASLSLPIEVKARLIQTWGFKLGLPFVLLLATAISVYLYVSRNRDREQKRLKNRITSMRQRALASQMNRHFTFNSLNSIQRFVVENNSKSAIYYISRFGKLMRNMLHQSRQNMISLDEELQTLELYLSLEKMRARHSFDYTFELAPKLEPTLIEVPAGLLQPFIENAIWHGLMPLEKQGKLRIVVSQKEERLEVQIIDNGIGRSEAEKRKKAERPMHKSQGMNINQERIETLNSLYDWEISCKTLDLTDEQGNICGTKVCFELPFI